MNQCHHNDASGVRCPNEGLSNVVVGRPSDGMATNFLFCEQHAEEAKLAAQLAKVKHGGSN